MFIVVTKKAYLIKVPSLCIILCHYYYSITALYPAKLVVVNNYALNHLALVTTVTSTQSTHYLGVNRKRSKLNKFLVRVKDCVFYSEVSELEKRKH
jgi:hypothetical protein